MQCFGKLSPSEKKQNSCTKNIPKIRSQVAQWFLVEALSLVWQEWVLQCTWLIWNRAREVYPAALSAHFRTMLTKIKDIRYHCWVLLQVLFFCRIVQEDLNTIFLLFYWLFCFWCSSLWVNIFNNILVNTSVGNTGSCDPLWKHFIISYMNVVCVPIKSYKL